MNSHCFTEKVIFTLNHEQHIKSGIHLHQGMPCTKHGSLGMPHCTTLQWDLSGIKTLWTCCGEACLQLIRLARHVIKSTYSSKILSTLRTNEARLSQCSLWWTDSQWVRSHSAWGKPNLFTCAEIDHTHLRVAAHRGCQVSARPTSAQVYSQLYTFTPNIWLTNAEIIFGNVVGWRVQCCHMWEWKFLFK